MRYVIDRMSEEIVICEDENGKIKKLLRSQVPKSAREGDVMTENEGDFGIEAEETCSRRKKMREKMDKLT